MKRRAGGAAAWILITGGCLPAAPAGGPEAASTGTEIPAGYGSLRQDAITVSLAVDGVQIRVTPLDEAILRLTAPDTWERLSAVRARAGTAGSDGRVFLVAVQTEAPGGASFDPQDLQISSQGTLHRPRSIVPLTPGWGAGRLAQRVPLQALYVFSPAVDLDREMVVQVGSARSGGWAERIPVLEAERARVRARSGGRDQLSRPNFLILR